MSQRASKTIRADLMIVVFAIIGSAAGQAGAQAPDWSVDAASFSASMSITATAFSGGNRSAVESDIVAAFAGSEIRGVATATIVGDEAFFFLTAYANDSGETLAFRLYDAAADQVVDIVETVDFAPDGVIGSVAMPTILSAVGGGGTNRPSWSVDPAAFGSTMSMVAELFVGGSAVGDEDALIGAFVDTEVRGVASPILVSGRWLFFVTIYGDVAGEALTFQAYDPAQDSVVGVDEETTFAADAVIGSTSLPFALHAGGGTGVNRPSWTIDPASFESSMSVVAALFTGGVRSDRSADLVAAFAGAELRGVASPTSVGGQKTYFLTVYGAPNDGAISLKAYDSADDEVRDLNEGTTFSADAVRGTIAQPFVLSTPPETGSGLNAPDWTIDAAGFGLSMNVVGSLIVDGIANNNAASRVAAFVGEDLRGVASPLVVGGRSLFFLTVYANGIGEPITFRAYDGDQDRLRGVTPSIPFQSDALEGSTSDPYVWRTTVGANRPTWTPDPPGFSQTMSLTASLLINGEISTHPDNAIAAFAGSELRGSAVPEIVEGQLVFPLTLYANGNGETLRFEAYDAAADRVRTVLETIVFAAGTSTGTPTNPFLLSTAVDAPQAAPVLLSPTNGAVDVQLEPTLIWNAVPRAATYEIHVSTTPDFATATIIDDVPSSAYTLTEPLNLSTTYFWRVRGTNPGAAGPWSESRRFTTIRPSVGTEDDPGEQPGVFALGQNYPNPFNPATEIGYELAVTSHVRLVVHDLLGRTIATLVDAVQPRGRHSARFNGADLGSGLYVYRLQAGSLYATRSMTLVK